MTTQAKLLGVMVGLSLVGVGCAADRDASGAYDETNFVGDDVIDTRPANLPSEMEGNLDVSDATLRGTLGKVGVDSDGTATGFRDETYTTIYTNVDEAENGAVMTILDILGGLDHADLTPGTHFVFKADDFATVDDGELFVSAIGCSGASTGEWDFDQTADSVTVDVGPDATPEFLDLVYTAHFDTGASSVVTGALRIAR